MNYKTIKQLKKDAKKLRKNNNDIKNHSESLNIIAKDNDFNDWDDLINHSVILTSQEEQNEEGLNLKYIVDLIINKHGEFFQTLNTYNPKFISYFINENFKTNKFDDHWAERGQHYLDFACFLYSESMKENDDGRPHIHYLLGLNELKETMEFAYRIQSVKEHKKTKAFFKSIAGCRFPIDDNTFIVPEQDYGTEEQFNFLYSQYAKAFNEIEEIFVDTLGEEINKTKILDMLEDPINLSFFITSTYFNKDRVFEYFLSTLSNDPSLFDPVLRQNLKNEIDKLR